MELDGCPACGADWKAIDVSHGPACPKNLLEEAMDTPNGVWSCAGHAQQLGGESPLPNLMEVKG